jgi:uncharacterized protein YqjF (DUF2071 family)
MQSTEAQGNNLPVVGDALRKNGVFLRAEWRFLAMLNYRIDPKVLQSLIPAGTELDFDGDRTYVSVVGFRFLNTSVIGLRFPFHKNFEEVNLRFYVRRKGPEGWRRGVVFIKELVPRRAVTFIASTFYGEPYETVPMGHKIATAGDGMSAEYFWDRNGKRESLLVEAKKPIQPIQSGSHEEFITEHYWGYTARGAECSEYEVEHPRWQFWPATSHSFQADVQSLYGSQFVEFLSVEPASAFIADGSEVAVRRGSKLSARENRHPPGYPCP